MHKPKLFIGMPVYNGERFMGEAIDSILSQSFSDFVLFISDDSSPDATGAIAQRYAAQDPRVIYYRQPQNLKMVKNFKFVLDQADTEYFMWAAHDDVREKEYLKVCIEKLESDKKLGLATTAILDIDSLGRVLSVEKEVPPLFGPSLFWNVLRWTFQPEGFGKANLMYGVFRTQAAHVTWEAYPQRMVWALDYHFALALVSRFNVYVDTQPLFKKRLGGSFSTAEFKFEAQRPFIPLTYRDRNNTIPFTRFMGYWRGHMEALRGTPYQIPVTVILMLRFPRVFFEYVKARNYRKFIKKKLGIT